MEQDLKEKLKEAVKSGRYDARLRRDFSNILTCDDLSLLEREIGYTAIGAEGLKPVGMVTSLGTIYTGRATYRQLLGYLDDDSFVQFSVGRLLHPESK